MKNYRIAVVPGDGIGNEIVPAATEVLMAVAMNKFQVEMKWFENDLQNGSLEIE